MKIATSVPRFVVVGMVATLIHVAVAVECISAEHWHPSIANGIAFIVANIFSYAANTHWSFEVKMSMGSWHRFILVSLIAWLLTIAITWLVNEAGGPYLLGILLVVALIPPLTYMTHRNFTYR
jgi:putative flippase GtrA